MFYRWAIYNVTYGKSMLRQIIAVFSVIRYHAYTPTYVMESVKTTTLWNENTEELFRKKTLLETWK